MKNIFKIVVKMDEKVEFKVKSNDKKDAKKKMDAFWEKLK